MELQIQTEHLMGSLGVLLDPDGLTIRTAQLSKAELATLTKAAGILEALRKAWDADDSGIVENHPLDIDVAMAMYTMRQLVEENGRIEI